MWWAILAAAGVTPYVLATYPPLYDYYNWAFQGKLLSSLLFGVPPGREAVGALYGLRLQPVPNLAAPLGMAILNLAFSPLVAGRVLVALSGLSFAVAYGHLVRVVQRRPTALEVLGFVWANGYFMSRGYISFLLGLALAFVLIARLTLLMRSPERHTSPTRLVSLAVLGVATYLCHLFAWGIAMVVLACSAAWLLGRGKRRVCAALVASATPGLVLLVWYATARQGSSHVLVYESLLRDKALSLEPLLLFGRSDPFPPLVPTAWANLVAGVAVVGSTLLALTVHKPRLQSRPLMLAAGLLWLAYLVIPFAEIGSNELNSVIKPDERFTLPALLLALSVMPARAPGGWRTLAVTAAALLVLGIHAAEYAHFSRMAEVIEQTVTAAVPADARVLSVTVHQSATGGGCSAVPGPSVGPPALKWFGQVRALEEGGLPRTDVLDTGVLYPRFAESERDLAVIKIAGDPGSLAELRPDGYDVVEVFGCASDIESVGEALGARYHLVTAIPGAGIFQR